MTLKILVVGAGMYVCGRGTDSYGTVLPALYQAKKEGLVDSIGISATSQTSIEAFNAKNDSLAKVFGESLKIETYPKTKKNDDASYLEALNEEDYDCAIVVVPDHLHHRIAKELLQSGLHTLVVKPLTPDLESAKDLLSLCRSKGVYGAVEFHKRFDQINLMIKEKLQNKEIGDPLYILVEYSQRISVPLELFKAWASRTNIFQYLGIHYVDMIYFLTGFRPMRVMATGQKNRLVSHGIDTYDSVQAVIEWSDETSGKHFTSTILTNWIDPLCSTAMSDQKIKLIGTMGRIESDQKNRGLRMISDKKGVEDLNPYFSVISYDVDGNMRFTGYGNESINQFLRDCRSLKKRTISPDDLKGIRATFQEALVSTAVIEGVNKSLMQKGEWVYVRHIDGE